MSQRCLLKIFCVLEVMEECNDFSKEIPFLVDEEECEEVVFDECVEVSEKIPVEVTFFLNRVSKYT